jgi:hypothetical protein
VRTLGARLSPEARVRFAHVHAVDADGARVVVVPVLTPGVAAMTLGRWILVRAGNESDIGLLAHELVHVEQWRTHGVIDFLRTYLGDYVRGRRAGLGHWAAYGAIPFEAEARLRTGR